MESVPEICLLYDEDLSALLDGELLPARAEQVRSHFASCPRCSAQLAALRETNERILSALRTPLSQEDARILRVELRLRTRLAQEARFDGQTRRSRAPTAPRRARGGRWIALFASGLAAAAALALALLFQARSPGRPAALPPPPIAHNPPLPLPAPAPEVPSPPVPRGPEAVAELPAPKPAPVRPRPPRPPAPQPEQLTPQPSAPPEIDLAAADEEDLEAASRLDMLEDFEVIQKLDLLERLQKAEDGAGNG